MIVYMRLFAKIFCMKQITKGDKLALTNNKKNRLSKHNKQCKDCDALHAHVCRRAIVTCKVGQTYVVFGVRSGFISRSVYA